MHHEWRQELSLSFFQGLPKKLAKPAEKILCYLSSARVEHYICYIGILQRQIFNDRCKKRKSPTSGTSAKHLQVTQSNGDFTFFISFFYKLVIKQGWYQKHSNMVDNNKEIIIKKRPFLSPWKGQTARKFYLCLYMALFYVFKYFPSDGSSRFSYFSKPEDSQILMKIAEKKLRFWFVTFAFDEKWLMKVNFAWTFENRLNDKQQKRSDTIFSPKEHRKLLAKTFAKSLR